MTLILSIDEVQEAHLRLAAESFGMTATEYTDAIDAMTVEMCESARPYVRLHPPAFASVLLEGTFRPRPRVADEDRILIERVVSLFGEYPVFGYLANDPTVQAVKGLPLSYLYGGVLVELNKSVLHHSTMTIGDTCTAFQTMCVAAAPNHEAWNFAYAYPSPEPIDIDSIEPYVELQIFGRLDLSMIEEVVLESPPKESWPEELLRLVSVVGLRARRERQLPLDYFEWSPSREHYAGRSPTMRKPKAGPCSFPDCARRSALGHSVHRFARWFCPEHLGLFDSH